MLGWSLILLVVGAVAAFLGFGGVATAFAGAAKVVFFLALGLFVLSLLFSWLPGDRVAGGLRGLAILAVGALAGFGIYAWFDNEMSAEQVGREIDRGAREIASNADDAADRAAGFVTQTATDARTDAADTIDADENADSTD